MRRLPTGVLVAVEGIDGAGKTTQVDLLEAWARALDLDVVRSKEPTTGPWGMKVRNSKFTQRLSPEEELECFINDRKEHVETLLAPALARGALVLVDRYYYSTVAYQGARGVDPQALLARNRSFAPVPTVLVLLDLDPELGLKRIHQRGLGQDLFESVPELTRARAIFQQVAAQPHVLLLDGSQTPEQLHAAITARLLAGPLASVA
jgi:dTMP kinase